MEIHDLIHAKERNDDAALASAKMAFARKCEEDGLVPERVTVAKYTRERGHHAYQLSIELVPGDGATARAWLDENVTGYTA